MRCPFCKCEKTKVVDKRDIEKDKVTRRRRSCASCGKRFTTYERIENVPLIIIKKSGNKERFERRKLEQGILKACEKRPITLEQIKNMIDEIEAHLINRDTAETHSYIIGRMVMSRLKKLDKVSYIRFASVYKDFKDPEEFEEEIDKIKD